MSQLNRRRFVQLSAATAASLTAWPLGADDDVKIRVKTYTYKEVAGLQIKADVHRADDDVIRPVVVWIHGGALIMGGRAGISGRVKRAMLDAGYAIVSIDYRLAPETQLPGIIEDLEDAFTWVREKGPELFNIDPNRMAVMGGSAGGYLTLTSGFRVKPRPRVLVAFWGYGDLVGPWYSEPSKHPRHQSIKMTEKEAYAQVSGPPIANSKDRKGNGAGYYLFCRQHGLWPKGVSGWDPHTEEEKYVPYMPVRNVTKDYPPTVLIHGTEDTDVPHVQSVMMAEAFKEHGVAHRLISIAGGEHGLGGADPKRIDAAYESAFEFVRRQMKE